MFASTPAEWRQGLKATRENRPIRPSPPNADIAMRETILPYRGPFDSERLFGWLSTRAVPGVEHIDGRTYRRVVGDGGIVEITPTAGGLQIRGGAEPAVVRRVFDQ
jgi:hypothetical protein